MHTVEQFLLQMIVFFANQKYKYKNKVFNLKWRARIRWKITIRLADWL